MIIEEFGGVRWFLRDDGDLVLIGPHAREDMFHLYCPHGGHSTWHWGKELDDIVLDLGPAIPPKIPLHLDWDHAERWIVELRDGSRAMARRAVSTQGTPIRVEIWSKNNSVVWLRMDGRRYENTENPLDIVAVIGRVDLARGVVVPAE